MKKITVKAVVALTFSGISQLGVTQTFPMHAGSNSPSNAVKSTQLPSGTPVPNAKPMQPAARIVEKENQNPQVGTSIVTNTTAQVAVETFKSINENAAKTSIVIEKANGVPVPNAKPMQPAARIVEKENQNPQVGTSIMTNTSAQVAIETFKSINENLDTD